ncbi:MAG: DUF1987 domain-containing protein [Bacteroidetes bacterium]|nr:DUF1987 domain-containing protein [Bacteroidota bacterium]MBU1718995.1 DUF1987 domain-containing protein [Bacteroidota bacterium]
MPEKMAILPGENVPKVILDAETSRFEISGVCNPQNIREFSNTILSWLDEYSKQPNGKTNFVFKLDYFNFPSSKLLLDIMSKLENLNEMGNEVIVSWCYNKEDEDMKEAGDEYEGMVNLPFEKICIN